MLQEERRKGRAQPLIASIVVIPRVPVLFHGEGGNMDRAHVHLQVSELGECLSYVARQRRNQVSRR